MIHSKERIEAFSDAVFAFAATLIVVSLEVPERFDDLMAVIKVFPNFAVSFLALVLIWKTHYNMFRRIEKINDTIIFVNLLFLFVVLFYVFPLKFLAGTLSGKSHFQNIDELAQLFVIYGIGFVLVFLLFSQLYRIASKIATPENKRELSYYSNHYMIFVAVGIFSIVLALLKVGVQYGIPGFVYPLLGPLCYFYGKKHNRSLS